MLLFVRNGLGKAALLAVLLMLGALLVPAPAYADGEYGFNVTESGQPGEGVGISPVQGEYCPSGQISDVEAVLTDSLQQDWVYKIDTTNINGYWDAGVMIINPSAAHGWASITLRCKNSLGTSYPYYSMTWFRVTPQSTQVTMDRAQFGLTSTISSTPGNGCPANTPVGVGIYGKTLNSSTFGLVVLTSVGTTSGNDGSWSVQVAIDNTKFDANETYYARPNCTSEGMYWEAYYQTSYAFIPRWNEYVALGDSYSSGEGSYNYNLVGGDCHRSTDGYPHYLSDVEDLDLPEFQACSGAVTDDFYVPNPVRPGEVPQLSRLNEYTQTVTLTIGGNDMGFKPIAEACSHHSLNWGYSCGGSSVAQDVTARLSALRGIDTTPGDNQMVRTAEDRVIHPIQNVLEDIAGAAPQAKIYIAGYPKLFGDDEAYYDPDPNAPGSHTCLITQGTGPTVTVAYTDAQYLNVLADQLNDVISDAVTAINNPNIEYVDPFTFTGHGHCDVFGSWFNGVDIVGVSATPEPESLHPNVMGMQMGYGASFSYVID
jgi:hypothetical protein